MNSLNSSSKDIVMTDQKKVSENIISLSVAEKVFKKTDVSILHNLDLTVREGEKIAIIGESGVGKSSLLNILGLVDRGYQGSYSLFGSPTADLSEKQLARWRNQRIGFVLQDSALINSLNVEDNIKLPLFYTDAKKRESGLEYFREIVSLLGIEHILQKKPHSCSGGERSRAVFARGIIMQPRIILSDEPTASLDVENKEKVISLLFKMNSEYNTTIITVTHDLKEAEQHDRIVHIKREQ